MDSQISVVEKLLEEGEKYTFKNFCLDISYGQTQYGGADTPEWSTFNKQLLSHP